MIQYFRLFVQIFYILFKNLRIFREKLSPASNYNEIKIGTMDFIRNYFYISETENMIQKYWQNLNNVFCRKIINKFCLIEQAKHEKDQKNANKRIEL